jgi:hypothetical protein
MQTRYDYVAWDEKAQHQSDGMKGLCLGLEASINSLTDSREKSMAITKLEETFMWVGKAIRSDLLKRTEGVQK